MYRLPSISCFKAPLLTSRRRRVRTVASVHCLWLSSTSNTVLAATGVRSQTTAMTSHSASVMRIDVFICDSCHMHFLLQASHVSTFFLPFLYLFTSATSKTSHITPPTWYTSNASVSWKRNVSVVIDFRDASEAFKRQDFRGDRPSAGGMDNP
jgi:hypothetical protein